jgi:hypothetical protein
VPIDTELESAKFGVECLFQLRWCYSAHNEHTIMQACKRAHRALKNKPSSMYRRECFPHKLASVAGMRTGVHASLVLALSHNLKFTS